MYKVITLPLEMDGGSLKAGVVNYITATNTLQYIVPFLPIAIPLAGGIFEEIESQNLSSASYHSVLKLGELDDVGLLQLQNTYKVTNNLTARKIIAIAVQVSNFN